MPPQNIPIFKPNGRSMISNLTQIKKLEYIAWGAYKFKFQQLMDELATRQTIDGVEVWGDMQYVDGAGCSGATGPWVDMLDQMGFDDDGKAQLCSNFNESQVDHIEAYFAPELTYDVNTLDAIIEALDGELDSASKIRLTYTASSYDKTLFPLEDDRTKKLLHSLSVPPSTEYLGIVSDIARSTFTKYDTDIPETDFYEIVETGHEQLKIDKLMSSVKIEAVDASNNIIVLDDFILDTILSLVLMHSSSAMPTRTLISFTERDESGNGDNTIYHDVVEEYGASFITGYGASKFDDFHQVGEEHVVHDEVVPPTSDGRSQGYTLGTFSGIYNNPIWGYGEQKIVGVIDPESDFLFKQGTNGRAYMSVEGLRTAQMKEFFFYISSYLQFRLIPKEKKWWQKIIAGIMKFITSIVTAVLEVFNKIPILRLVVQALSSIVASIFGLDKEQGLNALANLISAIIIAYATGGLGTVGGVLSGAIAFTASVVISFATQLYSIVSKMIAIAEQLKEQKDKEDQDRYNEQKGLEEQKESWELRTAEEFNLEQVQEYNDKYDTFSQYNIPMPFDSGGEFDKSISLENINKKGNMNGST